MASSIRRFLRRVRTVLLHRKVDHEIERELASHVAMESAHRAQHGMSVADAQRTALRDFGGVVRMREEVRDVRGLTFWHSVVQDVRFGLRMLRRSPGYTLATIMVLGLGIGANTAIFSVVRGVLLKPLPFHAGDQLTLVTETVPSAHGASVGVSIPELADYRARLHAIRDLVEYHSMSFTLLDRGDPSRVDTGVVSANFFDMLGVRPLYGRNFVSHDDAHGADAVLMLSYPYWQKKFGGDPRVVGTVVTMNNREHTIVGILPDFPEYPRKNDVYMPTSACPFRDAAGLTAGQDHRAFPGLQVFGRLVDGATAAAASAEIATIAATFSRDYPKDYQGASDFTGQADVLRDTLVKNARPMLLALVAATLLILIIACANVANLAIGRTVRRSRELALRAALGAGRRRLLRQLLTESVTLALIGGVLGVTLARISTGLLVTFVSRFTPRTSQIGLDGGVLLFALGVSLLTGLVFGIAPALAGRRDPLRSIREGTSGSGDSPRRQRLRSGLVIAQIAVSFVLLIGAGLLLKSFHRLSAVDLGYDTRQVMTASIFGNFTTIKTTADAIRVQSEILDRLRSSAGVAGASVTASVPLSNVEPGIQTIHIEGRAVTDGRRLDVDPNVASDGYFETLSVPVFAGRTLRASDTSTAPQVAVINRSMAKYWDGADPVGTRFKLDNVTPEQWITVVGVVLDFHLYRADREIEPQFYQSYQQTGGFAGRLLVRSTGDPHTLVSVIKAAVHAVDPKTPVEQLLTLDELRGDQLESPGVITALLTIFAGVAILIALTGLAGILGMTVSQRQREFGVRMALGASRGSVLWLVLSRASLLVTSGLALGAVGAAAFSRLINGYLFATRATDIATYIMVALLFLAAGLVACAAPLRRATTIDPLTALRSE